MNKIKNRSDWDKVIAKNNKEAMRAVAEVQKRKQTGQILLENRQPLPCEPKLRWIDVNW